MYLHIDCESTGLNVPGVPSEDPRQPHLASISAVLDDERGETQQILSVLVAPEGRYRLEDYPEAFKVHGITTAQAEKYGWRLPKVLYELDDMARNAEVISAYNIFFDFKLLKIACAKFSAMDKNTSEYGVAIRDRLEAKSGICSMESAAQHLIGKKRISLANAHQDLFKSPARSGQYHGSMEDVMAHRRIFYELRARGVLLPATPLKREYATPYQGGAVGSSQEVQI
jgi:DNA polymerase-3 subunit alpha